jgi:N-acetylmuramoyl-L-alanine amidase
MNKRFVIFIFMLLIILFFSVASAEQTSKINFHYIIKSNSFDKGRNLTTSPKPFSSNLIEAYDNKLINEFRLRYKDRGKINPNAVLITFSKTSTLKEAILKTECINFAVHIAVDRDGKAYQMMDALNDKGYSAKGMDEFTIYILVIGKDENAMLENEKQKKKVADVTKHICNVYNIPKNNYDITSKRGVFSHYQAKFKYGGFVSYDGSFNEEGARYLRDIIWDIRGKEKGYYPHFTWKNRKTGEWVYSVIKPASTIKTKKSNAGKGITDTPKAELKSVEQDEKGYIIENMRIKYVHKKERDIKEITGVVLHYTLASNIASTLDWFNHVTSCSHIIVDVDGKAYQILDKFTHRAAAAYNTNDNCIQIEIVGRGESDLLKNDLQKSKVIEVVKEIIDKYDIPKNNYDIESLRGIFSHNQSKKKWGHSQLLYGKDFDPGERYMKEIIEGVGGNYYYDSVEYRKINWSKLLIFDILKEDLYLSVVEKLIKKSNVDLFRDRHWKDRYKENEWVFYPYEWIP